MATRSDFVNGSLGIAGLPSLVADYSEDSPQANVSRRHWERDYESFLAEAIWNFAKVTDTFPAATGQTHPRYSGVYSVNADSVLVWRVNGYENRVSAVGDPVIWEIEGEYLYTSYGSCVAEYITRNVTPARFSPKARDAFEHYHAVSIKRDRGEDVSQLEVKARFLLAKAKFSDSLEGSARPVRSNYLAEARMGRASSDGSDTYRNF